MADYKEMYVKLFNSQTKAINILQEAGQETERMFIESDLPNIKLLNRQNDAVEIKDIFQKLYKGEIYPSENIGGDNPQVQKYNGLVAEEKKKFIEGLSESVLEQFNKLDDLQHESAALYAYESFVYGFKLGVTLLFESLNDSTANLQRKDG